MTSQITPVSTPPGRGQTPDAQSQSPIPSHVPKQSQGTKQAPVPAPHGTWWLRLGSSVSILVPKRLLVVGFIVTVLCTVLAVAALGLGASSYSFADVIQVLSGEGSRGAQLIILEWRIPRIVLALCVGTALGVSGSIFQAITRNPLGSPDLIGFTMGAQTGILIVVVLFGGSLISVSLAALIGGIVVGALIYALSFHGGFGGLRLILAGIAISSMLGAFNRWMVVSTDADTAFGALQAVTGTLAFADWSVTIPTCVGIVVLVALTLTRVRDLRALELGPDLAQSLGTRLNFSQAVLVLLGTALAALATMAAGPIAFVALVSPHIARSLTRRDTAPLYVSGAVGALLLLVADVLAQTLLDNIPVGVVTASVGGLYFMGLLIAETRSRTS